MIRFSTRLTRWSVGIYLALLGTAFLAAWLVVAALLQRQVDEDLREDLAEFRQVYRESGVTGLERLLREEVARSGGDAEFSQLLRRDGRMVANSLEGRHDGPIVYEAPDRKTESGVDRLFTLATVVPGESATETMNYRVITGALPDGLTLHLGESMEAAEGMLDLLRRIFFGVLLLAVPVAGFSGWFLSRRAARDIEIVSQTAMDIRNGHLDRRVRIDARDRETHQLSHSFNSMLDRLAGLMKELREMTDNIAHDLKSPLARIRFMSELALSRNLSQAEREEQASQTIEECDRLIRMIDTSLDVAEAEAGVKCKNRVMLNLSVELADAIELFEPVAAEKGITLSHRIEPGLHILGHPQDIQRAISNLVDNAIKYTDSGGTIDLSLSREEDAAILGVRDSGVGIATADLENVFRRFYRCDRSRSREGCGLGLSFVRAVARQAGGDVTVRSRLGEGSVFSLRLPLSTEPTRASLGGERTAEAHPRPLGATQDPIHSR